VNKTSFCRVIYCHLAAICLFFDIVLVSNGTSQSQELVSAYLQKVNVVSRVSFGSRIVQKLKRISLDHNLLDNLQVREGDVVDLYFDTEEKAIVIKKSSNEDRDTNESRD